MSVLRPATQSAITSPPRPPSPPLGPPNSMNFSRRNATQPLPPSPERTYTLAWSRNFIVDTRSPDGAKRNPGFAVPHSAPLRAGYDHVKIRRDAHNPEQPYDQPHARQ